MKKTTRKKTVKKAAAKKAAVKKAAVKKAAAKKAAVKKAAVKKAVYKIKDFKNITLVEMNAKEMAIVCNALALSSEPGAKQLLGDFKKQKIK